MSALRTADPAQRAEHKGSATSRRLHDARKNRSLLKYCTLDSRIVLLPLPGVQYTLPVSSALCTLQPKGSSVLTRDGWRRVAPPCHPLPPETSRFLQYLRVKGGSNPGCVLNTLSRLGSCPFSRHVGFSQFD